jgi:hypothetical protein
MAKTKKNKATDIQRLIYEVERRVVKNILRDIDFGYDAEIIGNKIKNGSYVGTSYQFYKNHKKLLNT